MKLKEQVICAQCWHRCLPEDVLWISEHVALLGEPVVGPARRQRFLPRRQSTPGGDAVYARGLGCQHLICQRCHLVIPPGSLKLKPILFSVQGALTSGMSHYQSAATWNMRSDLPHEFGRAFAGSDPAAYRTIN